MSRYAVRIGSALALLLIAPAARGVARADDGAAYSFQGKPIVFAQLLARGGEQAVSIDDPGLRALLDRLGATVTWQPGQRYVLITTGEPVVISFALGETRYDVGPISQNAAFAPFMQNGHAYVPLNELLGGLDLAAKRQGARAVLQPQLAAMELQNDGGGAKLVAHAGIPLDAHIVSDADGKLVIEFDGVGSTLAPTRSLSGGAVTRIDIRTTGSIDDPKTFVTLYLASGTTHTPAGTDDQRDFTIGFNGAAAAAPIAAAPEQSEPQAESQPQPQSSEMPQAQAPPSPAAIVQVTSVQTQAQQGSFVVRVAVNGGAAFDWHRLRPPDNRWWIDVHGARLGTPLSDQPGSELVGAVRVHQEDADTVRVALSLNDFYAVDVQPDATGITISVSNVAADLASVARAGSGSVGASVTAEAVPSAPPDWKFGGTPGASTPAYVASNPRLIVIDPGHGGSDFGAIRGEDVEKVLNLDISKRLRDILVARGWQVVMTRDGDRDVYAPNDSATQELQARDDIANSRGARLLVSIHVNSFVNSGPHGATTYYYKPNDLPLAQAVNRRIASEVGVKDDGVVKDVLYVIHHARMPAALVETAFVSNPDDRVLLESPQWRQKMAQAIADGIGDYAGPAPAAPDAGEQ